MESLPHQYSVSVNAGIENELETTAPHLPSLSVAPPSQFDGPGDKWSPEELLLAAVANCYVLSFRTVAGIAKLDWLKIQCTADGVLDKVERNMLFTDIVTKVRLTVADESLRPKAEKLLKKAEQVCLVSNSLLSTKRLEIEVVIDG